jgi:hypothetical protein
MIPLNEFIEHVRAYRVPPASPIIPSWRGRLRYGEPDPWAARDIVIKYGMWAIVDMQWTRRLSGWIGSRSCLEIMAGAGWLARALSDHGVRIIATDNQSWNEQHANMKHVYPVGQLSAINAVTKYSATADILIVSWPPYEGMDICRACAAWGSERPIAYIGEGVGGCNAPNEFFHLFEIEERINIPQWDGIHDYLMIGHYGGDA